MSAADRGGYPQLPPGFRFGTSTAAYQIEGAAAETAADPDLDTSPRARPVKDDRPATSPATTYHRYPETR
jgi:beta-glucosidase